MWVQVRETPDGDMQVIVGDDTESHPFRLLGPAGSDTRLRVHRDLDDRDRGELQLLLNRAAADVGPHCVACALCNRVKVDLDVYDAAWFTPERCPLSRCGHPMRLHAVPVPVP